MKQYKIIMLIAALSLSSGAVFGQEKGNCVTDFILSSYSSRAFNSVPVSDDQIELILRSGIKAPSARNSQSWKFTVVEDNSLAKEIIPDVLPGNVLFVISGPEAEAPGMNSDIDCSIATAFMFLAGQSLGLASHIYGSPIVGINENMREKLEIPEGYRAILVLRMGNMDKEVDGVSAASPRNDLQEFVTYK